MKRPKDQFRPNEDSKATFTDRLIVPKPSRQEFFDMSRVAPTPDNVPEGGEPAAPDAPVPASGPANPKHKHYPYPEPDYGQSFSFDPDFKGPVKSRKCTDIICLGIFFAFLGGWAFVAYVAINEGDISKIIFPTNSKGEICGRDKFANRSVLLFFDLTKCLNPAVLAQGCPTKQICVTKCPDAKYSMYGASKSGSQSHAEIKAKMRPYCELMSDTTWNSMTPKQLLEKEYCPPWILPSTNAVGRCLPQIVNNNNGQANNPNGTVFSKEETGGGHAISQAQLMGAVTKLGAFLSVRNFGERVFSDISATWWMILVALGCALVISFLWIVLMRFFAGVMVWTSLGLLFIIFSSLFGYCLYRYLKIKDMASAQGNIFQVNFTPDYGKDVLGLADTWLAFTIILGIIVGILLLVLIALRQRVLIAIELIEEASKAVGNQISTLTLPILPFALQAIVAIFFLGVALSLASAGQKEYKVAYALDSAQHQDNLTRAMQLTPAVNCTTCQNPKTNQLYRLQDTCDPDTFNKTCPNCPSITCQFTKYVKNGDASWMQFYNIFGFYWGICFASALGELILAGTFATWYWTFKKSDVPCCAMATATKNAIFYHLGTVAFGSCIIAIIKFIRTIVAYIENKLKLYNNDLTKCLICVCQCCLWCLEKFMRFINRNAYIMCAIKGTNFCTSARDAFSLLMRNILRVVVLNNIVNLLLFLGKVVIMAIVGCLAYFFFSGNIPNIKDDIPTLNYLQTPIVVICIGSYMITSLFFGVYAMAVDTLFLCFLEDSERNDGTKERPYFMSRGLQKVVGKMQKFKEDD